MNELGIGRAARGTTSGRPLMVVLDALGRRGMLRLLWELQQIESPSFRQLVAACESNPGTVNSRLKELRELRLVDHRGSGYLLTEQGAALVEAIGPLNRWAAQWAEPAADAGDVSPAEDR